MKQSNFSARFAFVDIVRGEYSHSDNRHGSPLHFVACMEEGRAVIVGEQERIEVGEGELFYIPSGEGYQSYWYGNPRVRFRSLGFSHFPGERRYPLQVCALPVSVKEELLRIPCGEPDCGVLGAFYTALARMESYMTGATLSRDEYVFTRIRDALYASPMLSLSEIALRCAISESAMYASFKRLGRGTPNELRLTILCNKASELLTVTDKSVEEISSMLGFSSSSYFRKVFRAHTGETPRAVRRSAAF